MCDSNPSNPSFACVVDGVTDPNELEYHRIGGAHVVLCRRCYRKLIESAQTKPERVWTPPDELETIAQVLLAEADFLAMLAEERRLFAQMLINRVHREVPFAPDDAANKPTTQSTTKR